MSSRRSFGAVTDLPLIAYELDRPHEELAPAERQREWMRPTAAKVCLPLLMANQSGWVILNRYSLTATWDGGETQEAIAIEYPDGRPGVPTVQSHFGHGILTWRLGYLFRTPPGWNLWVRGPANEPRDGASPLEGVVEADWSEATFTMNWKLTRPGLPVTFEAGATVCTLVPQRRGELEAFEPVVADIGEDPETQAGHDQWAESRRDILVKKFLSEHVEALSQVRTAWEKHYYKGTSPAGSDAPEHQTRLKLKPFARRSNS